MSEVLADAGFDFSDLDTDEGVEASAGPLRGSRGTRAASGSRQRRTSKAKLDGLQKRLSNEMFQAGTMIGLGLPVTGYYACQESDTFTKAVVQLAASRKEWIEALEHIADIGPGLAIGRTAVGLGAALAVDRGRADPEKRIMQFLGVYSAWEAVTNPTDMEDEGNAYQPPPAVFVPVS